MVAFDTVLNQIRLFVAPIAEFFGTFLTENIESATAAIALFASSMSKSLIAGAMPQIDYGRAAQVAAQVTGSGDLQETAQMSASRIKRLQEGTATEKDIAIVVFPPMFSFNSVPSKLHNLLSNVI